MVLLAIGAFGAFYIKGTSIEATVDAGIVDAFLATTLLYIRHQRKLLTTSGATSPPVTLFAGITQVSLGLTAIAWTVKAC